MEPGDFAGVVALQALCFPPPFPAEGLWQLEHLQAHQIFADGQFVAESDGQIIGSATNMLMSLDRWQAHLPWHEATGGLSLSRHQPNGEILYGIDISIHPGFRRCGVGRSLYEARFQLGHRLGLAGFGTVCRLPGYQAFQASTGGSPKQYANSVAAGSLTDATLTPLLRMNLTYVGIVENYMEDEESGHAGAILERLI